MNASDRKPRRNLRATRRRNRRDGYFWLTMNNQQARLEPLVDALFVQCTGERTIAEISRILLPHGYSEEEALRLTLDTMEEFAELGLIEWAMEE